jgi:lipid II:glycine glycyltransferase (peptidoglycan interpeptide bridge formation enzyme)
MSKITLAPLPKLRDIIKSIFTKPLSNKDLSKSWKSMESDISHWFSRSAFAMLAIAKWYELYTNKKSTTIWIPDYFCNEPLQLLRKSNFKLHFYPITDGLIPNWELCRDQSLTIKPDIFFLVHYFGYPSDGINARKFCNEYNCILVEDAAHVLIPQKDIGLHGEFVFYSPHKLLAISDGSVLIQRTKTKVLRKLSNNNPVKVMRQILEDMPQKSPSTLLWLLKRTLQKFLPDFLWIKRLKEENIAEMPHGPTSFKPMQSKLSRKLLTIQIPHINKYVLARQTNQAIISSFYNPSEEKALFQIGNYIPYISGIRCKTDFYTEEKLRLLKRKRSPVMKWPDLPPEVLSESDNHTLAIELQKNLFFSPVHQSLNISAIKRVGSLIGNKNPVELNNDDYKLEWFKGSNKDWQKYIELVVKSNLLQSWAYGKAKEESESWTVKRGLIRHNGNVTAIFQALEKSFGFFRIIRINRGPMLLSDKNNFKTKYNIYKLLCKTFQWWKGRILLIAPELISTPENLGVLALTNFRKRSPKPWQSAIIDLSLSEDNQRKNLNGKWRNQLKKSEQRGLELNIGRSSKTFFWLLDRYAQMMKDKSFTSTSIEFYSNLYNINQNNFFVFQALLDEKIVAGILIIRHGNSCTYNIGWNSQEGRKLYANNFLLWNSILEMKRRGCVVFDLGGIDQKNTPDITRFKRGLKGKEYTLVGEWVGI